MKILFFSKKVYEVSKYVNTKYCVLVPDDDFLSLSAVKKCIKFLDKNQPIQVVMENIFLIFKKIY